VNICFFLYILLPVEKPVFFNQKALYVRELAYMTDYTLSKEKIAELVKLHRSLRDKRQAGFDY